LSRRLGDDPLTRARSKRIKAVESSTSAAPDAGEEQSAGQVGIQTASRASYNDVFFQRRGEGVASPQVATAALAASEVPEISEISEIPEIREVAAASGNLDAFDVTTVVKSPSKVAQDAQAAPALPAPIFEGAATLSNAEVSTSTTGPVTEVKSQPPSLPDSSQAPANGGESKPESQKSGGFFKRLFGKFK
jgi:hypothetical protein